MAQHSRAVKVGSIVWALVIGLAVLALGVSIMLPSTKRARFDFQPTPGATTEPSTQPTTEPTTAPATDPASRPS